MFLATNAARRLRALTRMNPWSKPDLAQDAAEWLGEAHPLVEQLGLAIEELLDLLLQEEAGEVAAHAPRSFQLAASMNWRQRV